MAFLKDKSKEKATAVIKSIDKAIAVSNGLAELIGCVVVLVLGSVLGTEITLPEKPEAVAPSEQKEQIEG